MKLEDTPKASALNARLLDFYRMWNLIKEDKCSSIYKYAVTIYHFEPHLHFDKEVLLQVLQIQTAEIESQLRDLGAILPTKGPLKVIK